MFVNQLQLINFRNYSELDIKFNSEKILLTGKNAQGKTNLLEALYYISMLNSFRAKNDLELIRRGSQSCMIRTAVSKYDDADTELEVFINPPERRKLKINGINKSKPAEFISGLSCVCFSSSDLMLLRGAPENRRKRLDFAVCRIFPAYIERILKYNRIRIQKNNCLKNIKAGSRTDREMLDIWNEQLALAGSNIIFIRINFLHELYKKAKEKHKQISGAEDLTFSYNSAVTGIVPAEEKYEHSAGYIMEAFLKRLDENRQEEIARAQSITGPHRDDISFYINGCNAESYASQGQQRTIVLALKLAQLEFIREKTNAEPVLLLDDVLAELDDLRQNYLLDAASGSQTIITSADMLHFKDKYIKDAQIVEIKDNKAFCLS